MKSIFFTFFMMIAVCGFAVPPQTVAPTSPQGQHQAGESSRDESEDSDDVDEDVIIMEDDDTDEDEENS